MAIPGLLRECDRSLLETSDFPRSMWAQSYEKADRLLANASSKLGELSTLPVLYEPDMQRKYESTTDQLEQLRRHVLIRRIGLEYEPQPTKHKGRRPSRWTHLMLIGLADWWHRQGWQPTQQPGGCFLRVARLLRAFRIRARGAEERDFDPATVRACILKGQGRINPPGGQR